MTVDTRLCLYPWDVVGDPEAAQRFAATGAVGAAVASAYHSVRAATPRHPEHRIVDAATAAIYFPLDEGVWSGRRLRPREATPWAGRDSYRLASTALADAGLQVEPWVVLTHAAVVGAQHPDVVVRNAFGDAYSYALCPSSDEVLDYAVTLAGEAARFAEGERMMVEASGPLGLGHLGHHEKTAGADWSPLDETLLSVCFCASCELSYRARGADPGRMRTTIRGAVGAVERGHAALDALAPIVLPVRTAGRERLATGVREAASAQGVHTLAFHAQSDPWATGPFVALDGTEDVADEIVLPAAEALSGVDAVGRIRSRGFTGSINGYLNALPPASLTSITREWPTAEHLDGIYAYHAGLISADRLDAVSRAIQAPPR